MTLHIGISKLRLMAGKSKCCTVCNVELRRPPDGNHLCTKHTDVEMHVVDGNTNPSGRRIGEMWTDG